MKTIASRWLCWTAALAIAGIAGLAPAQEAGLPRAQTLAIGRRVKPPVLDGKLDDWGSASFLLGEARQTLRRPGRWAGAVDASAAVWLTWDEQCLYLAADVVDDKLMQAHTGAEPWHGDTLELFFNIFPGQQRVDGFWQIAVIPPLEAGENLWVTGPQKDFEGVEGTAVVRKGGYTLECQIPWKNLTGLAIKPGANVGFQVMLDDRDDAGRKSQLTWYPGAVTFNHPMQTNTLVLKEQGETAGAMVAAGPPNEVVTNPQTMAVSVLTDLAGAEKAVVKLVPAHAADGTEAAAPAAELQLAKVGDRVSAGEAKMDVSKHDGPAQFEVIVQAGGGQTLARTRFATDLGGRKYEAMKSALVDCQKRVAALPAGVDELERGGLRLWVQRIADLVPNEARPETVSPALLTQMVGELEAIGQALSQAEQGHSAYADATASMVRGYRSPLTGAVRGYALYVPSAPEEAKQKQAVPLIVVLHPIFADARYLLQHLEQFKGLGAIVYQGAAYLQFDWGGISAAETWAGLSDVLAHYPVDRDRIYLVGIHAGGRGTWQMTLAKPDIFAAAAPLFSGIDARPPYPALRLYPQHFEASAQAMLPAPFYQRPDKPVAAQGRQAKGWEMLSLATRAENLAGMPTWSAYGEEEPDATAERLALLESLGTWNRDVHVRYEPGAAHGSMPGQMSNPEFWRWLLAQRRPAVPAQVRYVATDLRNNEAWWVKVQRMQSPLEPARVDAKIDAGKLTVNTTAVEAFSLVATKLPGALPRSAVVDGQELAVSPLKGPPTEVNFWRDEKGTWQTIPRPTAWQAGKRHGLSGPINDYQFDRFMYVYGTGGTAEQSAALEKLGRQMADWGLGAVFQIKADKDVMAEDLKTCHIIAVGTPANNAILKRAADRGLAIKWVDSGIVVGEAKADGPGAGACVIGPNPLADGRYLVVLTATDADGYAVWQQTTGCDWVVGKVGKRPDASTGFIVTDRGYFDGQWQWKADLSVER